MRGEVDVAGKGSLLGIGPLGASQAYQLPCAQHPAGDPTHFPCPVLSAHAELVPLLSAVSAFSVGRV